MHGTAQIFRVPGTTNSFVSVNTKTMTVRKAKFVLDCDVSAPKSEPIDIPIDMSNMSDDPALSIHLYRDGRVAYNDIEVVELVRMVSKIAFKFWKG